MDGAEQESVIYLEQRTRRLNEIDENPSSTTHHDLNSFDALAVVKRSTDKKDPYYIYKIRNGLMSNETDYVFKSSRVAAQLALDMDIDGCQNPMQQENAYFDTGHSRVHGFLTICLWVVHPALAKIVNLASMEIRSESMDDVATFFTLFNLVLHEVSGDMNKIFNPCCFVCDESGANYNGVQMVFGDETANYRVKGCQWHFKNDVKKKANDLPNDIRDYFTELCEDMCKMTTVSGYQRIYKQLIDMQESCPQLECWIQYWHLCQSHVFLPFQGGGIPFVNLSEQGNSSWKPDRTLRLVHAAINDVSMMMIQDKEIILYLNNECTSLGKGPSQVSHAQRDRKEQMNAAVDFCNIINSDEGIMEQANEVQNLSYYMPRKDSGFKPPGNARME